MYKLKECLWEVFFITTNSIAVYFLYLFSVWLFGDDTVFPDMTFTHVLVFVVLSRMANLGD